ncbi:MAG: DUF72 domain-containing protein [Nitrososphaeraceae archaeon]
MQFRIGSSGWSYSSWTGPFYPPNLENSDWLRFYSQIFDYVEIDSSFYRIPNELMVKNGSLIDCLVNRHFLVFFLLLAT